MSGMFLLELPKFLAAGAVPQYLTEAVALIVAGALIAYICFRLRLVPIVGFLVAGVLIGPNALGMVEDQALVDATAEIGVILLLFTIGIEFSIEKLVRIQKLIFGGGTVQVVSSVLLTAAVLSAVGVDWRSGIFTGMLVALSSTAIVLKLLADKGEMNSDRGQVSAGLLIFQDLAIVIMVLLVPILAARDGAGPTDLVYALLKAAGIIAVVLVAARRVMPKVLETVARTCSPELFLLAVIAICFGTAYLTSLAGVSLSLGAFLAGLMVSESRFSQQALSETLPLQILFSATFFVSVGMLLDVGFLVSNLPIVAAAVAAILVIKIVTTWLSIGILGYAAPVAAGSALLLAQIGEFSFVLAKEGGSVGLTPADAGAAGSQTFIAATVVLMVATPFLMRLGDGLSASILKRRPENVLAAEVDEPAGEALDLKDHVIVAGYGEAARYLVRILAGTGIPYVITTLSPDGANEAETEGLPVVRGDSTKPFVLHHVGVEFAKMMVIADDNPAMTHRVTSIARQLNPTMRIVVRTRLIEEAPELTAAGADSVIAEELESIVQLFGEVLRDYRIPAEEIEGFEEIARSNGYAELLDRKRAAENSVFRCETDEDCYDSRTVTVREGAPVAGRTVAVPSVLADLGLELKSVKRNGAELPASKEVVLTQGDEMELFGPTEAFAQSAGLFRAGGNAASNGTNADRDVTDEQINSFDAATGLSLESEIRYRPKPASDFCSHLGRINHVFPSAPGCEDCLRIGEPWVHLRICLTCGHVGCCDTSKYKHASAHFRETDHPIIKSIERSDDWAWCFVDEDYV